jgi:peptide/nickel transport system permease protein
MTTGTTSVTGRDTTSGPWLRRATRTSTRRRPPLLIGLCFVVVAGVAVMAVFGTALAPQNPNTMNVALTFAKPSAAHWLGTNNVGQDVLSRIVVGSYDAFIGPLVITVGSMVLGNLLGLLAGYYGGRVDSIIMRWVDLMWAVPGLVVIIVVVGTTGGGYWLAIALLLALSVPFDTRMIRGATLEQTPRPYVEAAKTLGVPNWRIMLSEIWPNVASVTVANSFLNFAGNLVALSGLAFLGIGLPPGSPDWGSSLAAGESVLFVDPVAVLAPGVMIVLLAGSMNLIGDWLYERLSSKGATR